MMGYDAQIVVRCSRELRRAIDQWARKNGVKPADVTRRVLENAFGLEQPKVPIPSAPTQGAPGNA